MKIPVFPLNTVLFPGQPIKIQIFEDRYIALLDYVLEEKLDFGVFLIRTGMEAHGPLPQPHDIGTMASILDIKRDGKLRYNITCIGGNRKKIISLDQAEPFLQAQVQDYGFAPATQEAEKKINEIQKLMSPLIFSYLQESTGRSEFKVSKKDLPADPHKLIFLAANLLQNPIMDKQKMLESQDMLSLSKTILKHYQESIKIARAIRIRAKDMEPQDFSMN